MSDELDTRRPEVSELLEKILRRYDVVELAEAIREIPGGADELEVSLNDISAELERIKELLEHTLPKKIDELLKKPRWTIRIESWTITITRG